ncbi:single-stranded DNA-binding protein [Bacillus alkalicellulosilyticus]|uniref:single-stranded DNA-binding protein n=1 Tax=Alkalihalobacterium alkalicellulosilyticum TaxID=1912214 RepID=UPI0009987C8C|nr:single-stranded DNA-binding protein [Bacillus alkalicellulosilyticus]
MLNQLLDKVLEELDGLKSGEEFLIKELFKGYEWNRLEINVRRNLGIYFLNLVNTNDELGIEVLEKTSSNQQKYKKL